MPAAVRIMTSHGLGRAEMKALGTGVELLTTDPRKIAQAASEVQLQLAEVDAACSRFRPDSELEVANRSSGHPVAVGPLLSQAIETALRGARLTDGDLDPTVGEVMRVIGYDRSFNELRPSQAPVVTVVPVGGWTNVRFNPRWGTLHCPAGIKLDLGATAKALAADLAAVRAQRAVGGGVLVNLGGDISTAGEAPADGWNIRVTDWHGAGVNAPGPTVRIESGGLATSSTTVRRWTTGSGEMHHIVDPATGRPAPVVWRTVSAAAATCVDANIATTTAIIRGERSVEWLSSLGLAARLVRADGSVIVLGGWPEERAAA
jgi:FAD:protein FMN transferase